MVNYNKIFLENYTYIDLFAGIGGFHLAMSSFGAKCVFASEWDKYAAETYEQNFKLKPYGDITQIQELEIPKHGILCGGFPCQAFSIAGKQKGFDDIRGTLFFEIVRIAKHHSPKVLFLENVKNLVKHDNGRTFATIVKTLKDVNYAVFTKILNASNFGLPQNRERIYIVAFHHSINPQNFQFPMPSNNPICLENILEDKPLNARIIHRDDIEIYKDHVQTKSIFGELQLLNKPIQIGRVNKGAQGERIYHPRGHAITLSAYGGGVGSKTGLYFINGQIRKLSPRECARIQGFPDGFILNKIDFQSYKQFGNSVSVDVLQAILIQISQTLKDNE